MSKKKIMTLALCVAMAAILAVGTLAYFTDTTENVQNTFTMGKVKIELDEAKVENGEVVDPEERVTKNDYTDIAMVPGNVYLKDPTIHVKQNSENSYVFLDMQINKYSSLFWVMAADAAEDEGIKLPLYQDGALSSTFANESGVFGTTKFLQYMVSHKDTAQKIINKWFTGIDHTKWEVCKIDIGNDKAKYLTVRLAHTPNYEKDTTADVHYKFMDSFQMPASVTQEMIESGKTIGGMKNNFNTDSEEFHMDFKAYAIQEDELETLADAYKAMFGEDKPSTVLVPKK